MLPDLQHYEGTSAFLPAFSTCSLRSMIAWMHPPDHAVLRLLANPELPFAMSITTDNAADQQDQMQLNLRSLSGHMPFITQLRIHRWDHGVRMNPHAINSLARHLPLFTRLERLELNFVYGSGHLAGRFVTDAEHDRQALQAWRKVNGRWDEYPTKEFQKEWGFGELDCSASSSDY
ncbi:hypothetical protein FB45DRAFT_939979 [Roridomyces roridus]|uniref:Uncharacterized protein n=1 Tax=Roridomyces roridus TaxID=1738132 RepID=A0AAD7B6N5_9AGAR|nr:hypothetical protein FB45DRAFT_939979 [Roridomyces roridus]